MGHRGSLGAGRTKVTATADPPVSARDANMCPRVNGRRINWGSRRKLGPMRALLSCFAGTRRCNFLRSFARVLPAAFLLSLAAAAGASSAPTPLRVAIVGLEHGHVEGFLRALPGHKDVQLVGIADGDPALLAKYQKKYSLPETLLFKSEANMIEVRRPQAVLVYTPISEHRHAIEIAAQYGVSVDGGKAADDFAGRCAGDSADGAPLPYTCAGELRDHVVREQPRGLRRVDARQPGRGAAGGGARRAPGSEGDRRAAGVFELADRPGAKRSRRALRLWLLRRGPDDVADARRSAADGDGGGESRQAAISTATWTTIRRSC